MQREFFMIRRNLKVPVMVACLLLVVGCSSGPEQTHFQSPQAAVDSFVAALRANDTAQLKQILGPGSEQIISSGDPIADRYQTERFLTAYDKQHRLQNQTGGGTTLLVGEDDWPFPVPIVEDDRKYIFDTAAGEDEILNRRIGRNELETEQVCLAIIDAQREYAERRPMGGDIPEYAQKLISDPGKKNGLFWPTEQGEKPSPLGPLVAEASDEGYTVTRPAGAPPPPYHGYYYRLLKSQGSHAPGGALEYVVDGKFIGGFGVIAYPAQYGNSGIMSFMTNHDGVIYQRDLGPETAKAAESMTSFDPGPGWKPTSAASAASATQ